MRPVTIDLTPLEALTLLGIVAGYAKARQKRSLPASVSERIHQKVDKALLDATNPDHLHLGEVR